MKFKNGKAVLTHHVMPDPDEAKRLWKQGKSAQWIIEQTRKREKEEE